MAKDDTSAVIPSSRLLLMEAEEHYALAVSEIIAMRKEIRDRGDVSDAEVKRVTGNYSRATQTLFDERKKIEEFDRRKSGAVDGPAIDFDALRGEIGRALDRLRPHCGPG